MELCAYYLQSRYYMPTYHRFLNSDIPTMIRQKRHEYAGINLFTYCCNNPVNKYDPNGTWSNDVHDGYNPNTENHFYYLDFDGIKEYYGTYYWATIIGYSNAYAKILGYYSDYVDIWYSSIVDWRRNDKWHFYTKNGEDVRGNISHEQQSIAKNYLQNATDAYYKWTDYTNIFGANNTFTQTQYSLYLNNVFLGIKHLGYSLHPIQDMFAHIRSVCYQFKNKRWFHLPGNVDNASLNTYAVLGPTASKTLEILVTFYNKYYILRI